MVSLFLRHVCCMFQAKPIYGGWLLLAPEGTNFDNPLHRSRVRIIALHMDYNAALRFLTSKFILAKMTKKNYF